MFKSSALLLCCLSLATALPAQQNDTCNCLANLDTTIGKTEQNYAGYPIKINSGTRKHYIALVTKLRARAKAETGARRCFSIINEYVRFFKDKHFGFTYWNPDDAPREILKLDESSFRKKVAQSKDRLEGIYINPDTSLTIGIARANGGIYKAVVIASRDEKKPAGLVLFTLSPHQKGYLLKQFDKFSSVDMYAKRRGNLLQLWNFALWGKIFPDKISTAEQAEMARWRGNNNGLQFAMLNSHTSYLRIPTFMNNDSRIEKLVRENDSAIRKTDHLIIDLRGNGGGNTGWVNVLPYIMTNPIRQDSTWLRVSADNVKGRMTDLEPLVKNPVPPDMKKYFTDEYMAAVKRAYAGLPQTKLAYYPFPGITIPLDSVLAKPSRVAVLFDDLCGSSAEYFFYLSGQSKKVTRYGTNTVGMMDYEGMSVPTKLPYGKFILTIPVARQSWAERQPIDQTGFTPDVRIDLPAEQWIDFVQKHMAGS